MRVFTKAAGVAVGIALGIPLLVGSPAAADEIRVHLGWSTIGSGPCGATGKTTKTGSYTVRPGKITSSWYVVKASKSGDGQIKSVSSGQDTAVKYDTYRTCLKGGKFKLTYAPTKYKHRTRVYTYICYADSRCQPPAVFTSGWKSGVGRK
ncbi:hypothetical protein [Streptosporangium sp. KLBMP 9127]|nr:hypothetical protein [Streptosporangium sp. KLBMP 9127]